MELDASRDQFIFRTLVKQFKLAFIANPRVIVGALLPRVYRLIYVETRSAIRHTPTITPMGQGVHR